MQRKTNMKTIMKTSIYLTMLAMLLTMALARPAAAQKLVPFSGTLQAAEAATFPSAGTLVSDGSGGGIATLLGRFTITWHFTVNLADGTGSGPVRFTAANGDEIFTTARRDQQADGHSGRSTYYRDPNDHRWHGPIRRCHRELHGGAPRGFDYQSQPHLRFLHGAITSPGSAK